MFAPHFFDIFLLFIIACTFPPSPFRRRSLLAGRTPPLPLFHILGGGGGGGGLDSPPEREDSLSLSLSLSSSSLSLVFSPPFPSPTPSIRPPSPSCCFWSRGQKRRTRGFFSPGFFPALSLSLKGRALHKREKFRPPSIPSFRQQYCIGQ